MAAKRLFEHVKIDTLWNTVITLYYSVTITMITGNFIFFLRKNIQTYLVDNEVIIRLTEETYLYYVDLIYVTFPLKSQILKKWICLF
jgi:hypothetical protein